MSYQDGWYIEKRVAIQRLYGVVTVDDAEMACNGFVRLLEEGIPLVHFVVDVTAIDQFPTDMASIKRLIPQIDDTNMGWLIICGANNVLLRFQSSTLAQLGMPGVRLRMLDTLEESFAFLQEQDASLGNIAAFGDTGYNNFAGV